MRKTFVALIVVLLAGTLVTGSPAHADHVRRDGMRTIFRGNNIYAPDVMADNFGRGVPIYRMWYGGWQEENQDEDFIYHRTSWDRANWSDWKPLITPDQVMYDYNVLHHPNEEPVAVSHINDPSVTKHYNSTSGSAQYTMFYTICGEVPCGDQRHTEVWSAVSSDGYGWSHHEPVLDDNECDGGNEDPCGAGRVSEAIARSWESRKWFTRRRSIPALVVSAGRLCPVLRCITLTESGICS